jgi:hypothetical protein
MMVNGVRRWVATVLLLVTVVGCADPGASSRDVAGGSVQFGTLSPSGAWRLGNSVTEGRLPIESVRSDGSVSYRLVLPRESDLKFVGWGPTSVDGADVVWVYSADIGSRLYLVTGSGVQRLPCPPLLEPPQGWPGEVRLHCRAG